MSLEAQNQNIPDIYNTSERLTTEQEEILAQLAQIEDSLLRATNGYQLMLFKVDLMQTYERYFNEQGKQKNQ